MAFAILGVDVNRARAAAWLFVLILTGTAAAESATMQMWSASAKDHPSDAGDAIDVAWPAVAPPAPSLSYEIQRATDPAGPFMAVGVTTPDDTDFVDATASTGTAYYYRLAALDSGHADSAGLAAGTADSIGVPTTNIRVDTIYSATAGPVTPSAQWFNFGRINQFVVGTFLCAAIIFYIARAQSGRKLYVRKIAGLQAVEEAIGRATEMGRPILFVPGIQDMDDVQTIAGLTILARVARIVAEYETTLNVPVSRSLVMTTARESIKEAYVAAGRPDSYNDQMVHYVTDEQFGYVAAVDGIMVRQKPATCLYMGAFFAESLIMAETGSEIGAIQIAGTAQPAQLPFFVAACDYTLIGEELFAASAYLSGEPRQLGSLKGQDVGKVIAMTALALGTLLLTLSSLAPHTPLWSRMAGWVGRIFQVN